MILEDLLNKACLLDPHCKALSFLPLAVGITQLI